MCVPGCQEVVAKRLSRRGFFKGAGAGAVAAAGLASGLVPRPVMAQPVSFSKVRDLTHVIDDKFPTYFGAPGIEMESMFKFADAGFNANRWLLVEHTGTHMDAPLHFSKDGASADEIPVEQLVVPLAVVDVAAKAAEDADYRLSPDDLKAWESANGEIPQGACVAMNSGWDRHVTSDKFRNADSDGVMHFPGFHAEAADFLMKEREVVGMAVDTLSLDHGKSADFQTHYMWLPSGRWGMECVANLGSLPAAGATLVAGGPRIRGASGGPSRLIALV
jgi:kynurenine formamidase